MDEALLFLLNANLSNPQSLCFFDWPRVGLIAVLLVQLTLVC